MSGFPPGPPPHRKRSFLRTAWSIRSLLKDPIGFVHKRFEQYGDTYHVDEGGGSHLLVTRDPEVLRDLLVNRAADFQKAGSATDRLKPVLGHGLLTADGELWKRQRRLMQPHFHRKVIAGYATAMVDHAERLGFSEGQRVDLSDEMMALTLRIVCKALFDHDVTGVDRVAEGMDALRVSSRPTLVPRWVPTRRNRRLKKAMHELDTLIADLIEQRTREGLREDLLSLLLGVEGGMERQQLRDELVTLFLAGHETTSHALTWTWYLLSQHPEVEARLHEEVDALGGPPTVDDLGRLEWTRCVVSEAMRLYPPAFAVARVARVDTRIGPHEVPAATQVAGWIYWSHHDPRWFTDPERYDPERFLREDFPKHAYLPFGAGTRMCIGAGFALLEMQMLLASIARRYRFELAPDQRIGLKPMVTLSPRYGMRMIAHRRES